MLPEDRQLWCMDNGRQWLLFSKVQNQNWVKVLCFSGSSSPPPFFSGFFLSVGESFVKVVDATQIYTLQIQGQAPLMSDKSLFQRVAANARNAFQPMAVRQNVGTVGWLLEHCLISCMLNPVVGHHEKGIQFVNVCIVPLFLYLFVVFVYVYLCCMFVFFCSHQRCFVMEVMGRHCG